MNNKIKLGVIFGGKSTENQISIVSAGSILKNLNPEKYEIYPIYIDILGKWYKCTEDYNNYVLKAELKELKEIENVITYLQNLDVVFPILHGKNGEDGTIQGMFEMFEIPYVGCGVFASSIAMDKIYTKIIFNKLNLNQAKYKYIKKENDNYVIIEDLKEVFKVGKKELEKIAEKVSTEIKYPMFVKPSSSGSSVGVKKVESIKDLITGIEEAGRFDNKILIEEAIIGKEVECAVLGNSEVISSRVGQVISAEEFYSYSAKYENEKSLVKIPANITASQENEIRRQAEIAFKAIDGKGLSRVDFFIEDKTNKIYINEINSMPGFTDISMYPKLMANTGIEFGELIDRLIELALEK